MRRYASKRTSLRRVLHEKGLILIKSRDIIISINNNMNDFKKHNNFGGARGGSRGYQGGGRDGGRNTEMFQAVCASCNKSCEVPFRPNGKKPVYCKDCFSAQGGQSSNPHPAFDRSPRRDFQSAPSFKQDYKPAYKPAGAPDASLAEMKRSLDTLNIKLDRLIQALGDKSPAPAAHVAAATIAAKAPAKTAAPKAAAKKPAPKAVVKKTAPKKKK